MEKQASPVERLIQELSKLPGIGPKSAQRIAYHLLRAPAEQVNGLALAITNLREKTHLCPECFNITDGELCNICSSEKRDKGLICVVEQPQDITVISRLGSYNGLFHVLHGAISPTEGIGTSNLKIDELIKRLERSPFREVIIATNPTMEGEQTALYLKKIISPLGIKVTRLARGLPFGTELEYADNATLTHAIEGRAEF
jgi:recombination protein RecR